MFSYEILNCGIVSDSLLEVRTLLGEDLAGLCGVAFEKTAEYFANKYDRKIYLLGRNDNETSADAYDTELGCKVEYKNNSTASINSIDKALREANKQAPVAVIVIKSDISMGDLRKALNDRTKRCTNITSVTLIRHGKDVTYRREEIILDDFKIKLEDFK